MAGKIPALSHMTKAVRVYEAVKELIIAGDLPPGDAINQGQLASDLGVSTTPVREAMRSLEKEGWVVSIGNGELAVRPIEPHEMAEVYEVKASLELDAVELAALRRTDEDIAAMRSALALSDRKHGSQVEYFRATRAMHEAIYRSSHHSVLVDLLDGLWDRYERHQMVIKDLLESPTVQHEHATVVAAVIAGDKEAAVRLLREHMSQAKDRVHAHASDDSEPDLNAAQRRLEA